MAYMMIRYDLCNFLLSTLVITKLDQMQSIWFVITLYSLN